MFCAPAFTPKAEKTKENKMIIIAAVFNDFNF